MQKKRGSTKSSKELQRVIRKIYKTGGNLETKARI